MQLAAAQHYDAMIVLHGACHAHVSWLMVSKATAATAAAAGPKLHPHLGGAFTLAVASALAVAAEHVACTRLGTTATKPWLVLAALGSRMYQQAT
jgi:hypothetical protein